MAMTIRLAIPRAAWPRKGLGFVTGHSTALPSASPQTASEHRQCSPGWGRLLGQQPHTCKQHRRGSSPRGSSQQPHQGSDTSAQPPCHALCAPSLPLLPKRRVFLAPRASPGRRNEAQTDAEHGSVQHRPITAIRAFPQMEDFSDN